MRYLMLLFGLALLVLGACSGPAVTDPLSHDEATPRLSATKSSSTQTSSRSGELHVEKECSRYTGHAGDICTLTSSNLEQIPAGSTIRYARDAIGGSLDSDVILDPPGLGRSAVWPLHPEPGDRCGNVHALRRDWKVQVV